jgi:predicted nucleic acid-binding protein
MKVLVDTCVWSLALRRDSPTNDAYYAELVALIEANRIALIGPIRQELLSGIRHTAQFIKVRDKLRYFPDTVITETDYELAAENYNTCKQRGIQGSNTDFLICAVAMRCNQPILTLDQDFEHFSDILPIRLLKPRIESDVL